jgi:hypothetical protein
VSRVAGPAIVALAALSGCAPGDFALVGHDLGPEGGARLDQPLVFSFNDALDPGSVRDAALRVVRERDGDVVPGTLRADGATLQFRPRLPTAVDLSDAGLQPGERYRVEMPGLPMLRVLRGLERGALAQGRILEFRTIDVAALGGAPLPECPPEALFVDPVPGAPDLLADPGGPPRLEDGRVTLRFTEPLDPRALAKARFWLKGPWSRTLRAPENPRMAARLVDNQEGAVVELVLERPPPAPIDGRESYAVLLEPKHLRDLAGRELQRHGAEPEIHVPLQVER